MTSRNAHCVSGSLDGTSKGARKIGLEERSESRQNAIYAKTGGKIWLLASLQASQRSHDISVFKFLSLCMLGNSVLCAKQLQTKQYLLTLSTQFLCLLDSKISETQAQALTVYWTFTAGPLSFHDFRSETPLSNYLESGAGIKKMIRK